MKEYKLFYNDAGALMARHKFTDEYFYVRLMFTTQYKDVPKDKFVNTLLQHVYRYVHTTAPEQKPPYALYREKELLKAVDVVTLQTYVVDLEKAPSGETFGTSACI